MRVGSRCSRRFRSLATRKSEREPRNHRTPFRYFELHYFLCLFWAASFLIVQLIVLFDYDGNHGAPGKRASLTTTHYLVQHVLSRPRYCVWFFSCLVPIRDEVGSVGVCSLGVLFLCASLTLAFNGRAPHMESLCMYHNFLAATVLDVRCLSSFSLHVGSLLLSSH